MNDKTEVNEKTEDEYSVLDEMACAVTLTTKDKQKAIDHAYNTQSVLRRNGKFLHDYSC